MWDRYNVKVKYRFFVYYVPTLFYIKLFCKQIHYWVPEPYNISVPMAIPHDMPENIKRAMVKYKKFHLINIVNSESII